MPSTLIDLDTSALSRKSLTPSWRTVVWDDPINLMEYVTSVFIRHFGLSRARAHSLMLEVHTKGRAIVATGMRERMEADVVALHGYGLRATLESSQ